MPHTNCKDVESWKEALRCPLATLLSVQTGFKCYEDGSATKIARRRGPTDLMVNLSSMHCMVSLKSACSASNVESDDVSLSTSAAFAADWRIKSFSACRFSMSFSVCCASSASLQFQDSFQAWFPICKSFLTSFHQTMTFSQVFLSEFLKQDERKQAFKMGPIQ